MEDGNTPNSSFPAQDVSNMEDPSVAYFVHEFLEHQLTQSGFEWRSPLLQSIRNHQEFRPVKARVGSALRNLADEFTNQFRDQLVELCDQVEINSDTLHAAINVIADELFAEGVKWVEIVALFVFGKELALMCNNRNLPDCIAIVASALSAYISGELMPWINDHGGWEGLIVFQECGGETRDKHWSAMKNALCLSIGVAGALALGAFLTNS